MLHHRIDDHALQWYFKMRQEQKGRRCSDGIVKSIFLYYNCYILVIKGPNNYKPALNQIMVWHNKGDKPSSETMMAKFTVAYMRHSESLTSSLRGDTMHTPILWVTRHTVPRHKWYNSICIYETELKSLIENADALIIHIIICAIHSMNYAYRSCVVVFSSG